tara:strand:+ start:4446 stop:4712 length:267 start_codon:yes stop_codon:yes gene_type:complete
MIILNTSIQTTRAFIRYENIQHISWEFREHKTRVLVKIHSSAQDKIIEECDLEDYNEFLRSYRVWAADRDSRYSISDRFRYSKSKGGE